MKTAISSPVPAGKESTVFKTHVPARGTELETNGASLPVFNVKRSKGILFVKRTKHKHTAILSPPSAGKESIALLFCKENETHGNTGMY
ncbi:hypothetical protein HMPREF1141_1684 [Clostridium sp. MSTE9]|nr:hypothetical protein HMPREF1141_1684 [Clostridium sp. MSTE9]